MKKFSIQVIALAVLSTCWSTSGEHTDNEKLSVAFVEYFTSVTNQLLSSGQPLPWINVDTGGN